MNFKNLLSKIEQFVALLFAGVHTANQVPGVTNADKRAVVVATVVSAVDALAIVAASSADPRVAFVGAAVDVVATVYNKLTAKADPALAKTPTPDAPSNGSTGTVVITPAAPPAPWNGVLQPAVVADSRIGAVVNH